MPFSPITIANFFLLEYGLRPKAIIHKLVYLAHGWYMEIEGRELVDEEPQAWVNGPVFPSLSSAININQSSRTKGKSILLDKQDITLFIEKDSSFFRAIYTRYGALSESKLKALTYSDDSPWHQMVYQYLKEDRDIPDGIVIKNDLIRIQFEEMTESQ